MSSDRQALVISTDKYDDRKLSSLRSPVIETEELTQLLRDPAVGDFEVRAAVNQPEATLRRLLGTHFASRKRDDLLLLYIACHGVKNEAGELYFAATDTEMTSLEPTSISAEFINRQMSRSRSQRVILLLDCCYSGAFMKGMTPRGDDALHLKERFEGRGRVIITSSNAMEYAWEGESLVGEGSRSFFTAAIVQGLKTGEADRDADGLISVDELYDYVVDQVREVTPHQTPSKWNLDVKGDLFIAKNPRVTASATKQRLREVEEPDRADVEGLSELLSPSFGRIGNRQGAGSDRVADEDQLNFEDYVQAFVDLIRAPDTKPPLTIGIYGSWGMGKSFLLQHIQRSLLNVQGESGKTRLRKRKAWLKNRWQSALGRLRTRRSSPSPSSDDRTGARAHPFVHVVDFNAWEYSATDVIWPGLVRKIMDRLEVEVSWGFPGRFTHRLWRNLSRQVKENRGRLLASLPVLIALIAFGFWQLKSEVVAVGAGLAVGVALIKIIGDGLSSPLSEWITTLFQESDYGKQIGYMAEIRTDLEFLEKRLRTDNGRILVTVDDLDRCEPEKAVEVLQAINLLLNFDSFIVCLGIDARIVTRAVERHYKDLLGPAGASGYEYLDKVVQIPFRIPLPTAEEVDIFLSKQMGDPSPTDEGTQVPTTTSDEGLSPAETDVPANTAGHSGDQPDQIANDAEETVEFTYEELQAFQEMTPYLRANPRHLKRLVNVYRLVRSLAQRKDEEFVRSDPASTVRWLVMAGQWPYATYSILRRFQELLEDDGKYKAATSAAQGSGKSCVRYLYELVADGLSTERQRALDDDPNVFLRLLDWGKGEVSWEQLRSLSQYTINFNPAVEAEFDSRGDGMAGDQAQGGDVLSNG